MSDDLEKGAPTPGASNTPGVPSYGSPSPGDCPSFPDELDDKPVVPPAVVQTRPSVEVPEEPFPGLEAALEPTRRAFRQHRLPVLAAVIPTLVLVGGAAVNKMTFDYGHHEGPVRHTVVKFDETPGPLKVKTDISTHLAHVVGTVKVRGVAPVDQYGCDKRDASYGEQWSLAVSWPMTLEPDHDDARKDALRSSGGRTDEIVYPADSRKDANGHDVAQVWDCEWGTGSAEIRKTVSVETTLINDNGRPTDVISRESSQGSRFSGNVTVDLKGAGKCAPEVSKIDVTIRVTGKRVRLTRDQRVTRDNPTVFDKSGEVTFDYHKQVDVNRGCPSDTDTTWRSKPDTDNFGRPLKGGGVNSLSEFLGPKSEPGARAARMNADMGMAV